MGGEEAPALRQGHGMRKYAIDVVENCAYKRDQIMPDAQQRFPLHRHIVREQQVEVL